MKVSNLTIRSGREVYRLRIARSSGYVSHYFHFIMDFVWPIFHWLDNDVGWLEDKSVTIASMERGPFFSITFFSRYSVLGSCRGPLSIDCDSSFSIQHPSLS